MPARKGRPDPRALLEHQAASLLRKKRRVHGDFTITSTVIPHKHVREFIAEMLERDPHEAHTPTISGEKNKHRRLQLTATGRWEHSIFRPFPKPWSDLSSHEQEKLYHYFTQAAKDHARGLRGAEKPYQWIRILGNKMVLARFHVDDIHSGLRVFKLNHGEPGEEILNEARKYEQGWKNLHSILKAIHARAVEEE